MCLDEFETAFGKNLSAFKSCVTKLFFSMPPPYRQVPYGTASPCCHVRHERRRAVLARKKTAATHPGSSVDRQSDKPSIDYQHVYAQAVALGKEVMTPSASARMAGYSGSPPDIEVMREHDRMFMISNYMEDQILRYYRVPGKDVEARIHESSLFFGDSERVGGCPALARYIYQQNTQVPCYVWDSRAQWKGIGWFVMRRRWARSTQMPSYRHRNRRQRELTGLRRE